MVKFPMQIFHAICLTVISLSGPTSQNLCHVDLCYHDFMMLRVENVHIEYLYICIAVLKCSV